MSEKPHPLLPTLTAAVREAIGAEKAAEFDKLRAEAQELAENDPFRYGFEPPIWKKADEATASLRSRYPAGVITELDLGGNRASKTERRAKRLVQNMVNHPGWRAWALQSTETSSNQNQQNIVWKYLPPEWKPASGKMRGGPTTKIVYNQAGGFTENVLVCPNGSECRFKFYSMSVGDVEGAELDEAWGDELITPDWIEALIFRLVTRNGLLGLTFTPIEGYTQTVKQYLDGAVTIEEAEAELLPIRGPNHEVVGHEKVPRVQENIAPSIAVTGAPAAIIYFHTSDNPFGNYESMKATLAGASRERILTRAYGFPSRSATTQFPLFKDPVHVVSANFFAQVVKNGVARYHLIDPCPGNRQSGRNWFMLWLAVDALGRKYFYREWPSHGHAGAYIPGVGNPGPWTIPGKPADGLRGPAQASWGWSLGRYKEEILRLEAGETIYERWMDSRYGNAPTVSKEESTTLIDQMRDALGMEFLAAPGGTIAEGVELINNDLYYDVAQPVSLTNSPKMFVVETCPNLIYSLKEWTGIDGLHGASKDPIDLARYAEMAQLGYVSEGMFTPRLPWMEQFGKGSGVQGSGFRR